MSFSLRFISEPYIHETESPEDEDKFIESAVADGEIQVGDFTEEFWFNLSYWEKIDYERQWVEGLKRITEWGYKKSILIVDMQDPSTDGLITGYVLYQDKGTVYIQEHFFAFEDLPEPFDENNPYKHISEREPGGDEDGQLSEWSCSIEDVELFLNEICES